MGLLNKNVTSKEITVSELNSATPATYDDYVWDQFNWLYRSDAARTIKWEKLETDYYKATLDDGSFVYYDALEHTARFMTQEEGLFNTEELWRREFSRRLIWIMGVKGIGQKELSELTGISQSAISYYTRGAKIPSAYSCAVIAQALNCSLDFLQKFK